MSRFEQLRPQLSFALLVLNLVSMIGGFIYIGGYKFAVIETTQAQQARELTELRLRIERVEYVGTAIAEMRNDLVWIKRRMGNN